MKLVQEVNSMAELRRQYKKLLLKHHPDNGGHVSDIQEINAVYDHLFSILSKKSNNEHPLLHS